MLIIIPSFIADAQTNIKFEMKVVRKNNKKAFIEVNKNKVSFRIGTAKLHFSNLFDGNKELSKYFKP
jgi:hypothetical protein